MKIYIANDEGDIFETLYNVEMHDLDDPEDQKILIMLIKKILNKAKEENFVNFPSVKGRE